MRKTVFLILLAGIPCLALAAGTMLTGPGYLVSDLDTNNQLGMGAAFRISEHGTAVGIGVPLSGGDGQAVQWSDAGSTVLPLLVDHEAGAAYDVSEQGVVVGESDDVVDLGHMVKIYPFAVLWTNGQPMDLAALVKGGDALELLAAKRINEKGLIAGLGRDANLPALRAFLFEDGIITDLGSLKPDGSSEPFDMNEQGCIVGAAQAPNNFDHAFLWKDGAMTDLHDPAVILGRVSTARAVNEHGVIVGSADFVDDFLDYETATVWDHGTITNLGVLGGNQSYARDINDHGTIVGTTTVPGFGVHAFIYRDGKMEDLNDLIPPNSGWTLANAHDIANDGRIVGEAFIGGALRPFLLVPDCDGKFEIYGAGCAGSGGFTPGLYGQGCPTPNGDISLVVVNGMGGAGGLLLFGAGTGTMPFTPGCDVQILPLLPPMIPLLLEGAGPGSGTWQVEGQLPTGLSPMLITLQALFKDAGGPAGFTVTNPLKMDIR